MTTRSDGFPSVQASGAIAARAADKAVRFAIEPPWVNSPLPLVVWVLKSQRLLPLNQLNLESIQLIMKPSKVAPAGPIS